MMYLYSNIIGTFVFNQNFKIREKILFTKEEALKNSMLLKDKKTLKSEEEYLKKFKNIENIRNTYDIDKLQKILYELTNYKDLFYEYNMFITKNKIKDSVTEDNLMIQAIDTIDELNKVINILVKRLREWYAYYMPEIEKKIEDHETFVDIILRSDKKNIKKELGITLSMGKDLKKPDIDTIISFAEEIRSIYKHKSDKEEYLKNLIEKTCPNLSAVAGPLIGARLIALSGSLKRLMLFPASTIQLLGAEKALFRHMKTGARCPKYGIIFQHPYIQKTPKLERGKAARHLADKIALAVKVDYFKGEFIGEKLNDSLKKQQ